jgi:asparagine synthase (glutamine-hydrolysing)
VTQSGATTGFRNSLTPGAEAFPLRYNWVDAVKEYCASMITDEEFSTIAFNARGHNVPQTKEEAFYRQMFWELFGHKNDHLISEIWRPR